MSDEKINDGTKKHLFNDNITSWLIVLVFLIIYLRFPSANNTIDAKGWGFYLDLYRDAPGNLLFPLSHPPSPDKSDIDSDLGERQLNPGWWILFNPHHLLYLPITAPIFRAISPMFPNLKGIHFLQVWNSLLSALTLFALFKIYRLILPESNLIIPWCAFVGFSVTFFHYATDAAQYPTSVFFLTFAALKIAEFFLTGNQKYLKFAAFFLALAVLFHQIVFILVPFLLLGILIASKKGSILDKPKYLPLILISIGIPVAVYLIIGCLALLPTGEFSVSNLIKYFTLYAGQNEYWTSSPILGFFQNLLTFVGFYFGNERTEQLFFYNVLFTLIAMFLPSLWLTTFSNLKNLEPLTHRWFIFSLYWILPLLLFLSLWVPWLEFYHLFLVVPVSGLSLIGVSVSKSTGFRKRLEILLFIIGISAGIILNISYIFRTELAYLLI